MLKNITLKGFLKKSGIALLLIVLLPTIWFGYFIFKNDAPIIKGEVLYGIPYKDGLSLDIYTPTKIIYKKTPVVFFIHGGAWIGGRKESINVNRFNGAINQLRESGYAIVSPEYTLAEEGKSPFPACINDVSDAVAWVKSKAEVYNFDLENLGIFGESAGAHIAMMNAFPKEVSFNDTYEKTVFNYVVDVYGPTQLEGIYHSKLADSLDVILTKLPETISAKFNVANYLFGFNPKEDTVRANGIMKLYSPINYVNRKVPPVLIIHGTGDIVVPFEQSLLLIETLCKLNAKTEFHSLENVNHAFIGATDEQRDDTQRWIVDFIKRQYRKPKK